jgi:hypothetical protein
MHLVENAQYFVGLTEIFLGIGFASLFLLVLFLLLLLVEVIDKQNHDSWWYKEND